MADGKWQTEQIQSSEFGTQDWCPVFPRWFDQAAPNQRGKTEMGRERGHRAEADGVNERRTEVEAGERERVISHQ